MNLDNSVYRNMKKNNHKKWAGNYYFASPEHDLKWNESVNVLSFGVIKNYIKKKHFYKKAYFRSFVEDSRFTDILTFFTS